MTYSKYIKRVNTLCIKEYEGNHTYYLDPNWKQKLYEKKLMKFDEIEDSYSITIEDIKNELELEVIRLNKIHDKSGIVIDWLHNVITSNVEPAILQEETDYLKNLTEYLSVSRDTEKNTQADNVTKLMNSGFDFSKR